MTRGLLTSLLALLLAGVAPDPPPPRVVPVVRSATIRFSEDDPKILQDGDFVMRHSRQVIERTLDLPARPRQPADMPRIRGRVHVEVISKMVDGRLKPNDTWNRLGSVSVLAPGPDGPVELEMMRFITPYGGPATFEQDLTPFAPLLLGRQTIRVFLASYSLEPAWRVSLDLIYEGSSGYRNPKLVEPAFNDAHVDGKGKRAELLTADVNIPEGLERPRLRILTTGHATDGIGEHEFVTATHRILVDGREVCRWRPWAEGSTELRKLNPWAGRRRIGGQEVWASDLDRTGWNPGLVVEPLYIPLNELTPGPHRVQIEIRDLNRGRRGDEEGHHGYWVVSGVVLADEPWVARPERGNPGRTRR